MEKLYTRKEAAKRLGIGLTTLDTARAEGRISYIQYTENGSVLFTEDSLQDFVARHTHRAKTEEISGRKRGYL